MPFHTCVCVHEYMCRWSMNLVLGIGAEMTHTVGPESLNKAYGRKKVSSVLDWKDKAGNSIKMVEERRN